MLRVPLQVTDSDLRNLAKDVWTVQDYFFLSESDQASFFKQKYAVALFQLALTARRTIRAVLIDPIYKVLDPLTNQFTGNYLFPTLPKLISLVVSAYKIKVSTCAAFYSSALKSSAAPLDRTRAVDSWHCLLN